MRNIIKVFLFLLFMHVFVAGVYACSFVLGAGKFEAKSSLLSKCEFENEQELKVNCGDLNLDRNDRAFFEDIIEEQSKFENLSIRSRAKFEKQSEREYQDFLDKVDKVNNNKCDCKRIEFIDRFGEWTAFRESDDCSFDSACQTIYPEGCLKGFFINSKSANIISLVVTLAFLYFSLLLVVRVFSLVVIYGKHKNNDKKQAWVKVIRTLLYIAFVVAFWIIFALLSLD